ncbi:hypothetical protein CTN06_03630 [Pectobacterium zantedeschiae]|nr:hypothetical protein CTN06_03630 [Pectobacterium zantedeschiae]
MVVNVKVKCVSQFCTRYFVHYTIDASCIKIIMQKNMSINCANSKILLMFYYCGGGNSDEKHQGDVALPYA